jgi:hypothetical protein
MSHIIDAVHRITLWATCGNLMEISYTHHMRSNGYLPYSVRIRGVDLALLAFVTRQTAGDI